MVDFNTEGDNSALREQLEEAARTKGSEYLHAKLSEADPVSAEQIHPNNCKRIIRALEFYELNGSPISAHNEQERKKEAAYQSCYFVLNDDRQKLYRQIENRIDSMLNQGLVQEVKMLKDMGYHREMVSMQGLGYKEILDYLDGKCTLEEAVYLIKRDTRRFAKRQLTWFRRERDVIWLDKDKFDYDTKRNNYAHYLYLMPVHT